MDVAEKRRLLEALTNAGISVVPVWWLEADGSCACRTNCWAGNRGKHPIPGVGWGDKATADMRKVDNWLASYPESNWGVLTGLRSNIFVVDVDKKSGGLDSWERLIGDKPPLPKTLEVLTGSGGKHFYFRMPKEGISTKIGLLPGIDVKGEGNSQVVCPPSRHQSGDFYEWVVGPLDGHRPAEAPAWLIDLVLKEQRKAAKARQDMSGVAKLGTRDDVIFHNALNLLKQGLSEDLVVNAVWGWIQGGGVEQTPQDMIDRAYVEAKVQAAKAFMLRTDPRNQDQSKLMFNDRGNARRLVDRLDDQLRHCHELGWIVWTGQVWQVTSSEKIAKDLVANLLEVILREEIAAATRASVNELSRWLRVSLESSKVRSTMEMLSIDPRISIEADQLDQRVASLNFTNGTLDLTTGTLHTHNRDDFITKILPFDYDPAAECPTFVQTLTLACDGDQEKMAYLQRALGYSLTGLTSEQCFFTLYGDGKHGRSTLFNNLRDILGPYATDIDPAALLLDQRDQVALAQLARARGTRLVLTSEVNGVLNEERIKRITGGDTVTGRFLYQNPVTYTPTFVVWMLTNNKPTIRGQTEAIWRRVRLIPFHRQITELERRDYAEVSAEIQAQRQGVVAWAVRGALEWKANRLAEPPEVQAAIDTYRNEMDYVLEFVMDEYEFAEAGRTNTRSMYWEFLPWCQRNGIRAPMSSATFVRRLRKILSVTVGERSNNVWPVLGLKRREFVFGPEDVN